MNSNLIRSLVPLLCLLLGATANGEISFFDSTIDYWGEGTRAIETKPLETADRPQKKTSEFKWDKYMDPENKEFFKEGDYTPPEPFMEIVRDPSDKNIKMWFKYLKRKNDLSERLRQRIAQYQGKHSSAAVKQQLMAALPKPAIQGVDPARYRLRMYFDSKCPHCKRMFNTLAQLQSEGFFVEAFQIDERQLPKSAYPVAIQKAPKADLSKYDIQTVPLLLVGDLMAKKVLKLTGFLTPQALIQKLLAQEST